MGGGWCRPQVRQECAVERLAAFGLAAVKFLGHVLAWQGCAGSIEALPLGEWGGTLGFSTYRLCRR
jgi:hypothetical protein